MLVPISISVLGLTLELLALAMLFIGWPVEGQVVGLTLIHGLASILLAAAQLPMLPAKYKTPPVSTLLFLFSIGFFIPLLGALGLFGAVLWILRRPARADRQDYQMTGTPDLPVRPLNVSEHPLYGQAGLVSVLKNVADPEKRLKAVMATRQLRNKDAVPILRVALGDTADDVRLLAYSMLDSKEEELNEQIKQLLNRLEENAQQPQLHRKLSAYYWEFVFLGLATGEVLQQVLKNARYHLLAALDENPDNPGLNFNLGRILLRSGDLRDATAALEKSMDLGMSGQAVYPYLAEVAFLAHDFPATRQYLAKLDPASLHNPELAQVAAFWS